MSTQVNTDTNTHRASMSLDGVSVELGGRMALSDITFGVEAGTLMGVVGAERRGQEHSVQCHSRTPSCPRGEGNT